MRTSAPAGAAQVAASTAATVAIRGPCRPTIGKRRMRNTTRKRTDRSAVAALGRIARDGPALDDRLAVGADVRLRRLLLHGPVEHAVDRLAPPPPHRLRPSAQPPLHPGADV